MFFCLIFFFQARFFLCKIYRAIKEEDLKSKKHMWYSVNRILGNYWLQFCEGLCLFFFSYCVLTTLNYIRNVIVECKTSTLLILIDFYEKKIVGNQKKKKDSGRYLTFQTYIINIFLPRG